MNLKDKIETIMSSRLTIVKEETPVSELKKLFKRRLIHHILVENNLGDIKGIVSTEDYARVSGFPSTDDQLLAQHIMTKDPITINSALPIKTAINYLLDNQYRAMPVIDDKGALVGLITPYDIMSRLMADFENKNLNSERVNRLP